MQGVEAGVQLVEITPRIALAFRQETEVFFAGEECYSRLCFWRAGGEVCGQLREAPDCDQVAPPHTPGHLEEETQGHVAEFFFDPFMRGLGEVLVTPQGRETGTVGEADHFADSVVAFVVCQPDQ